jgi:hypothetical protein
MKLRLTENGPQVDQAPSQDLQAPAERTHDVKALKEHLQTRAAGEHLPQRDQTPQLEWEKGLDGRWKEKADAPPIQPQGPPLSPQEKLEQYRQAVIEAVAHYKNETQQHQSHAKNGHMAPEHPSGLPPTPKNPESAGIEERRFNAMQNQISQIEALTKIPIPLAKEENFKKLINERLDTLMELSPGGPRPDVERIRNQDDIRPRKGHQELSKDKDGAYWVADPGNPGQKTPADGPFVFVIPASNPSQIWLGERANGGHTAISRGGDVYYAGEIEFNQGQIVKWNNESGHYKPREDLHQQVSHTSIAMLEELLPRDKFVAYK